MQTVATSVFKFVFVFKGFNETAFFSIGLIAVRSKNKDYYSAFDASFKSDSLASIAEERLDSYKISLHFFFVLQNHRRYSFTTIQIMNIDTSVI